MEVLNSQQCLERDTRNVCIDYKTKTFLVPKNAMVKQIPVLKPFSRKIEIRKSEDVWILMKRICLDCIGAQHCHCVSKRAHVAHVQSFSLYCLPYPWLDLPMAVYPTLPMD
jgi:hypothetical protein